MRELTILGDVLDKACGMRTLQEQNAASKGGILTLVQLNLTPVRIRRGSACISCLNRRGTSRYGRSCPTSPDR